MRFKIEHEGHNESNPYPLAIGQDFAGEVVDWGKAVQQFKAGDRVFGFAQGAYAVRGCSGIKGAAIPNAIDFTTAAALATADPPRCKLFAMWWPPSTRLPSLFTGLPAAWAPMLRKSPKPGSPRDAATGGDIEYVKSLG